jgi:two-component system, LytTR family, sensor kinase
MEITIARHRTVVTLAAGWLLFWLLMLAVAVQDYQHSGRSAYWEPVLWESSSAVVVTALLALQYRWSSGRVKLLHSPARWFAAQLSWLPAICVSFVAGTYGIRHAVYRLAGLDYAHDGWGEVLLYESIKLSLFFGLFMVVWFGILSYRALAEETARAQRSATLLRQAQMERLTQQIQPHFLFNALNTVSSLMHVDADRADSMLVRLADILRASLDLSKEAETTLQCELRLLEAYAHLMAERFSDQVAIDWTIDQEAVHCLVPAMCLQPLLENTFKHTVEQYGGRVHVRIAARRDRDQLVLCVEDDAGTLCQEAQPGKDGGIGLANLRERLAALYGERAGMTLSQCTPAGVRTELRLPCAR